MTGRWMTLTEQATGIAMRADAARHTAGGRCVPRGRARSFSLADTTRLSETGPSVLTPARATDGPVLSGDAPNAA